MNKDGNVFTRDILVLKEKISSILRAILAGVYFSKSSWLALLFIRHLKNHGDVFEVCEVINRCSIGETTCLPRLHLKCWWLYWHHPTPRILRLELSMCFVCNFRRSLCV